MEPNGQVLAKSTTDVTKKATTVAASQFNKATSRASDSVIDAADLVAKGVSEKTDELVALTSNLAEQGLGIAKGQLATLKSQLDKFAQAAKEQIKKDPLVDAPRLRHYAHEATRNARIFGSFLAPRTDRIAIVRRIHSTKGERVSLPKIPRRPAMKSNFKAGCVTLLVCVTGATTHAFASTSLHLKNVATTRCLDVVDSQSGVDGGRVQAWTCLDAANQRWALVGATIRNSSHGKCLDEIKTNPGHVQIWACTGAANQNWTRYNDGTIRNAWSGRCLDEDNNAGGDGNRIQTFNCISNQMNQKWNVAD